MHALSIGLFGQALAIEEFPRVSKSTGIGLSDWPGYAKRLARVLNYRNTFFDRRPKLDISDAPAALANQNDFVISIDVFEHVAPPVMNAFKGVRDLLRPGGVFVLSVPYGHANETIEHFPNLHEFVITQVFGERCLINRTCEGKFEIFHNLTFHGGGGQTLEMRLFCHRHLLELLDQTGFTVDGVVSDVPERGIHYENECSHTIVARKK